jgi:hypothetical protein
MPVGLRLFRILADRKPSIYWEPCGHPALGRVRKPVLWRIVKRSTPRTQDVGAWTVNRRPWIGVNRARRMPGTDKVKRCKGDLVTGQQTDAESATTNNPCRGPGRGHVQQWTSARNRAQNSHFFSLFGPSGVTFQRRTSISKSSHAKQIEPDSWSSRASKTPCGRWDPKFSY